MYYRNVKLNIYLLGEMVVDELDINPAEVLDVLVRALPRSFLLVICAKHNKSNFFAI